jgi:acetyl esterase/lipase
MKQESILVRLRRRQPVKFVWILGAILFYSAKFSFLSLKYLFPFFRPHPKWSLVKSLKVQLTHSALYQVYVLHYFKDLHLRAGKEGDRLAIIPPARDELLVGVAKDVEIKPIAVPGTWHPKPPPAGYSGQVVVHFHGGAYVTGSGRDDFSEFCGKTLSKIVAPYALLPDYRLAARNDGKFPAALLDAISTYAYLNSLGIKASQIIISGDSAGGHLALSLLRYITESGNILSPPHAALLWSPAVDWLSLANPDYTLKNRNYATDYIEPNWVAWGVEEFTKRVNVDDPRFRPYLSFLGHPFHTATPLWFNAGDLEVLRDGIVEFADEMKQINGNVVEVCITLDAPHDLIQGAPLTGFEAEAEEGARIAKKFIEGLA